MRGSSVPSVAPPAQLTLRAHTAAPARVELIYNRGGGRALRTMAWIALCWGAIPFLLWVPPHYPWVSLAFFAGVYLAHRTWTGRFTIRSFAGLCPRCGSPLALGVDRIVDLPHTLTCFSCHFEPRLEVTFVQPLKPAQRDGLEHHVPDCVGVWRTRWLADEPFLFCERCHAGAPATPETRAAAERESETAELLARLANEGKPLI